jgi:hypothetical protein
VGKSSAARWTIGKSRARGGEAGQTPYSGARREPGAELLQGGSHRQRPISSPVLLQAAGRRANLIGRSQALPQVHSKPPPEAPIPSIMADREPTSPPNLDTWAPEESARRQSTDRRVAVERRRHTLARVEAVRASSTILQSAMGLEGAPQTRKLAVGPTLQQQQRLRDYYRRQRERMGITSASASQGASTSTAQPTAGGTTSRPAESTPSTTQPGSSSTTRGRLVMSNTIRAVLATRVAGLVDRSFWQRPKSAEPSSTARPRRRRHTL